MLKKLKGLFIEEDENETKKSVDKTETSTNNDSSESKEGNAAVAEGEGDGDGDGEKTKTKGKPEEKFVNRLLSALEENNIKGFDYLEYKQALQNLSSVDMDEATRFKSALAMATTMGANPANLITSAQHYLKILKNEEVKFLDAFKNQQSRLVSSRQKELINLEKAISTKQMKIEELTKEIEQHKAALEGKRSQANQATAKVQSTKENFYASYNTVVDQIKGDVEKMTNYLQ